MTEPRTEEAEQYVVPDDEPGAIEAREEEKRDDEETALEELIEEMVEPDEAAREAKEAIPPSFLPRRMRGEEFTCSSCHLIMARSCLADEERLLCHDCVIEAGSEEVPAPHLHVVERPCPVCGRVLLVPERRDGRDGGRRGVRVYRARRREEHEPSRRDEEDLRPRPARSAGS